MIILLWALFVALVFVISVLGVMYLQDHRGPK